MAHAPANPAARSDKIKVSTRAIRGCLSRQVVAYVRHKNRSDGVASTLRSVADRVPRNFYMACPRGWSLGIAAFQWSRSTQRRRLALRPPTARTRQWGREYIAKLQPNLDSPHLGPIPRWEDRPSQCLLTHRRQGFRREHSLRRLLLPRRCS